MRSFIAWVLPLVSVACASPQPPERPTMEPTPAEEPSEPEPEPEPEPAAEPRADPPAELRTHFSDLGRPCDGELVIPLAEPVPGPRWGTLRASVCGSGGTVAGVYNPFATYGDMPPLERVSSTEKGQSIDIGVAQPYLWARRVTCGRCAAVMGWGFAGDLRALEDEQLRFLQVQLDLPAEPLLRTEADWRAALADEP